MFLSLSLGHLALPSRVQRVMPGTLPDATGNEHSPREYCQVVSASCFLGPKGPPVPRTGLLPQNAIKGTCWLEPVTALCSCHFSTFCLKPFCLHIAFALLCNCGDRRGLLARSHGFHGCVWSKILVGKTCCPECILVQPLRLKSPKQWIRKKPPPVNPADIHPLLVGAWPGGKALSL